MRSRDKIKLIQKKNRRGAVMSNPYRLFMKPLAIIGLAVTLCACETTTPPYSYPSNDLPSPHYSSLSIADKNYASLQRALPMYESAVANPWPTLPDTIKLKPGVKNVAVLALRERLRATDDLRIEDDKGTVVYDSEVIAAVQHFQTRHGLQADGIIGKGTLAELNIPPEQRLRQIQKNMERWAKLSSELSNHYIMVNIPAYRLDLVENNQRILSMKAVVGKPDRPTPEINSTVTRVVFNPYWNIPKSIAQNDIVPKILQNSNYLNNMRIKIFDHQTDDATELNPDEIDWQAVSEEGFQYHLRQEPGTINALGLVKFEFQNSDDIYMHDTPAKNLFDLDKRDYSSGCIRLEKPFDLVAYLMKDNPDWDDSKAQTILEEGKTNYVKVANPTQVIITYLTTWVDDGGNVQFRDDIYGLDKPI